MNTNYDDKKRIELQELLFKLSKQQDLLKETKDRAAIYIEFENLYYINQNETFRHYYSDIYSILTQIKLNPEFGDINILGQNLEMIRRGYKACNKDKDGNLIDVGDSIKKLYDHINLDIARMSYADAQERRFSSEEARSKLQSQITAMSNDLKNKNSQLETLENKIKNSQKEYIAILGIFSAVVLAFTAGIAFSSSVLENIHLASIYRTVFVCCIIGLVLIDVIFLMFVYTERIVHGVEKIKVFNQHIPIVIANGVLIVIMLLTFLAWDFGYVEKRNESLNEPFTKSESVTEETTSSQIETATSKAK